MISLLKKNFPLVIIIGIIISVSSCRDDFDFELSSGNLYRLNVDGIPGKTFQDVEILAKDSIFIFVEVTADINDITSQNFQFLYTDQIQFDSGTNLQKVELVTLVQDAVFLYPERFEDGTTETLVLGQDEEGNNIEIEGFFLDDSELVFTNEKPYVVYGYAAVPGGKTLDVQAGARVHFHDNSGIIVANTGSIQANGQLSQDQDLLEGEIIFEGDRLEPAFADVPGQWGTIWMTQGSTNNSFNHVTIKNASVGMLMDSNDGSGNPTLTIKNTQIYNSSNVGLLARTGFVEAENLVVNNSGQVSVNLSLGGRYSFKHCTIANYWQNSFRSFPALLIENQLETPDQTFVSDLIEASFSNCIIYGNDRVEIGFNPSDDAAFNFKFENSLLRINPFNNALFDLPEYDVDDPSRYDGILLNEDPLFLDTQLNQLIISNESPAVNLGNLSTAAQVPQDILGNNRTNTADAGAYQSVNFEEE